MLDDSEKSVMYLDIRGLSRLLCCICFKCIKMFIGSKVAVITDRILLGAYELLNRTEFDAETVLKNFMEALIVSWLFV